MYAPFSCQWSKKNADTDFSVTSAGIQGCISAASNDDGEPLTIHNCNTEDPTTQDWQFSPFDREDSGPQPITVYGDKCIDVTNGVNADGTPLQIWDCVAGSTNQQWNSLTDGTIQWVGTDKCIDLTGGSITDGNVLQIWTCGTGNTNQVWRAVTNPGPADV
ncbi:ricin B lectin domain-containing protein [Mycena galericulata]|nr:ricin B lectin domain-containing protein [Mycena galericulata]